MVTGVVAGLMLGVSPAVAETGADHGPVHKPAKGKLISDQYIVVLKNDGTDTAGEVRKEAAELTADRGGDVSRTFAGGIKGFTVKASETEARRLAGASDVAYVEQDAVMHATETQSNAPWGLDRMDQRSRTLNRSYTYSTTASNVDVYVVDTGVRAAHTEFGGRVATGYDAIRDGRGTDDCNGHGTHVAGTIAGKTYGMAKGARIYPVRVLGCNSSGSTSGIIAGVDWVTSNRKTTGRPSVANLSLGGGASTALDDAVRRSISAGVSYVIAAGNSNVDASQTSPARVPEALTIGATSNTDARADFSNFGRTLDLFAPGVNILSASHQDNTGTATMSGTSMAAPHVAGAVALRLAAAPSATPAQIASAMIESATTGIVGDPGTGSPNRLAYADPSGQAAPAPAPAPEEEQQEQPVETEQPPVNGTFTSTQDVALKQWGTTYSPLTVANAPSGTRTATVNVSLKRSQSAGLVIDLVLPSGATVPVFKSGYREYGSDIQPTVTFSVGTQPLNGTWKLAVRTTNPLRDNGYIDAWSIRFSG